MLKSKFLPVLKKSSITLAMVAVLALAALSGCASTKVSTGPVFFPPEPNPPRVQYLMGIADSSDVEPKKSNFSLFLVGSDDGDKVKSFRKPYGVTVHKGKIYVSDVGLGTVVVVDLAKKSFDYYKGDHGPGKMRRPVNVAFDSEENMYVADSGRKEVVIFGPNGAYLQAFGRDAKMNPVDVAIYDGMIYVLDMDGSQINVFDLKSKELVTRLGKATEDTPGLAIPISMSMDSKGMIYATNMGANNVIKLDRDGHVLSTFGKAGDGFGDFSRPKGIAVDKLGRMYVVDNGLQNVQVFNENNRLLIFFGDPGLPVGSLTLPVGITVSDEDLPFFQKLAAPNFDLEQIVFVVSQFGKDKIAIYGLGKPKGFDEAAAAKAREAEIKAAVEKAEQAGKK